MTMDDIIQQADNFRHKAQDYSDDNSNPQVQRFRSSLQDLYNGAKAHKTPDYLFSELKHIEGMVQGFKNTDGMYNPSDVDDMYDRTKQMEEMLRQLSAAS